MKNAVKTLLCFVLILGTLLCLSACGGSEEASSTEKAPVKQYITGRYELEKIQWANGTVATGETLQESEAAMGDMYVELFSDSTAQLSLLGQIKDMEFSEDKMWQINYTNDTYDFSVSNGRVTLVSNGDTYTFVKK